MRLRGAIGTWSGGCAHGARLETRDDGIVQDGAGVVECVGRVGELGLEGVEIDVDLAVDLCTAARNIA